MFHYLRGLTTNRCGLELKTVLFVLGLKLFFAGTVYGNVNCPFYTSTREASESTQSVHYAYTFKPSRLNNSKDDSSEPNEGYVYELLSRKRVVECEWTVRTLKHDTVLVTLTLTTSRGLNGLQPGDCWTVYDGDSSFSAQLGKVCGGGRTSEKELESSGQSLFIVYTQGRRPGFRDVHFQYKAKSYAEDRVTKLAAISSGTVAAVAVCYLALKLSHCCRPCRQKWCPQCTSEMDEEKDEEEGERRPSQPQQLQHLTSSAPWDGGEDGSNLMVPPVGGYRDRSPSAPLDVEVYGFEPPPRAVPSTLWEEGVWNSTARGDLAGRVGSWESGMNGGGGVGRGDNYPSAPGSEPRRGWGEGGERGHPPQPPPSGISEPPPAYSSLFGNEGGQKI